MNDPKDVMVRATRDQIKDFVNSFLWKDIKRELGIWRKGFQSEYGAVIGKCINGEENSASALTHLGSLYGREMAIDYILQIPSIFLQILEDRKEEKDGSRHDETS